MGFLAPLNLREVNEKNLVYSTGLAALPAAGLFLFFTLATAAMWLSSKPLLERFSQMDPWLALWVPRILFTVTTSSFLTAILILGFVQTLRIDRSRKLVTVNAKTWGISLLKKRVDFDEIERFELGNVTPRRYRPESNPQGKPVGFWELRILTKSGRSVVLERAPKQEEIEQLRRVIEEYRERFP